MTGVGEGPRGQCALPDGDYTREGEALLCGLTGIAHMLVTVSEYPWAGGDAYVDMLLAAF